MIGQGSPGSGNSLRAAARRGGMRRAAVFGGVVFAAAVSVACGDDLERVTLRLAWGGGAARTWSGSFSLEQGRVLGLIPLGVDPDASANLRLEAGRVVIDQRLPSNYNGCDVEILARLDSRLRIELGAAEAGGGREAFDVELKEVLSEPAGWPLETGNRVMLHRAPGDTLPLRIDRPHLVFRTGETLAGTVRPNLCGAPPQAALILRAAEESGGVRTSIGQWRVVSDEAGRIDQEITISWRLPDTEGTPELVLELVEPAPRRPLATERVLASRRVQCVVLAADGEAPREEMVRDGREEFVFSPGDESRWSLARFSSNIRRLGARSSVLGHEAATVELSGRAWTRLAPRGWQAIPLFVEDPRASYEIEIEYDAAAPIALGISVLEPGPTGRVPVLGADSGILVPNSSRDSQREPREADPRVHRLTYWPSAAQGYLVLANHSEESAALVGRIRLLRGTAETEGATAGAPAAGAKATPRPAAGRQWLLHVQRPNFPQLVGAQPRLDEQTDQPIDDWQEFYTGAARLVQLVESHGYTGTAMTVAADGSAIYPSARLDPTPLFDTGRFRTDGADPLRKDVVELLYRLHDRRQLTFVPVIELSGLIPGLERRRAAGEAIELVHRDGSRWSDRDGSFRPPYNPLHPAVHEAVAEILDEFAARYGDHPSFAGIGLVFNRHTLLGLPGEDWGFDSATREAFQRKQAAWDPAEGELAADGGARWTAWRCERLAELLEGCRQSLRQRRPDAELFLFPVDDSVDSTIHMGSLAHPDSATHPAQQLKRMGLDLARYQGAETVRVLQPISVSRWHSPISHRGDTDVGDGAPGSRAIESSAVVFNHQAIWTHFEQLEKQGLFPGGGTLLRLQQLTPAGDWSRRRFAFAVAEGDPTWMIDAGLVLPQGQEHELQAWIDLFTALPAVRFEESPSSGGPAPLIVRSGRDDEAFYLYGVNVTPWPAEAEIVLRGPAEGALIGLSPEALHGLEREGEGWRLRWTVPAYGLAAVRGDRRLAVESVRSELSAEAARRLHGEIQELKSKLSLAAEPPPRGGLTNPGFETRDGSGGLTGWQYVLPQPDAIERDATVFRSGSAALRLQSRGEAVWIRSEPLAAPATGRVSLGFAVRGDAGSGPLPLRVFLEARRGNERLSRQVDLGEAAAAAEGEWAWQSVHFDDLPSDLTEIQIGFYLLDEGTVWLDDLELHDRWLAEQEVRALTQLLNLAGFKLHEQGDPIGCLRILESYWPRFIDQYYTLPGDEGERTAEAASEPARAVPRR